LIKVIDKMLLVFANFFTMNAHTRGRGGIFLEGGRHCCFQG